MKTAASVLSMASYIMASTSFALAEEKATDTQIVSHIVKADKADPTPERISSLKLPPGFQINVFAKDLENPRMMDIAPNGDVYVTQRKPGNLMLLKDTDGDGVSDEKRQIAEKKDLHGIAIHNGNIYVTTVREIFRAPIQEDGSIGELTKIIEDLPDGGQHPNRTIKVGPDGKLYITVGSTCNACDEPNERNATIMTSDLNGAGLEVFATGLRNTIGFGWHPTGGQLYGADHGIDWLGDAEQKEELNKLEKGKIYGWPYIYADDRINPADSPKDKTSEEWAAMSEEPLLLYTAHSAPMEMEFYTGKSFPVEYQNDAFLALHGSWNRKPPSGYEVVRIRFDKEGNPTEIVPFLTGFLIQDERGKPAQFGRPCGMAITPSGDLLLTDDDHGIIYRISYNTTK